MSNFIQLSLFLFIPAALNVRKNRTAARITPVT